jgi:hypothetical protein
MVALVLFLSLGVAEGAVSGNPSLSAGGGGMNVLDTGREVVGSQPPNLDGLILSSEVIGEFGLESELADDFVRSWEYPYVVVRWWGGYFNGSGCGEFGAAARWNLRVYEDDNSVPGNLVWETIGTYSYEYFIYCQAAAYPIFQYEAVFYYDPLPATRYWFSAQAGNHGFPPQVGRVAAASVVGYPSRFRAGYFAYPNWTPTIDVVGEEVDASLEFETFGIDGYDEPLRVCCIGEEGACRLVRDQAVCESYGGEWHGDQSICDADACETTPVVQSTWGQLKALFR